MWCSHITMSAARWRVCCKYEENSGEEKTHHHGAVCWSICGTEVTAFDGYEGSTQSCLPTREGQEKKLGCLYVGDFLLCAVCPHLVIPLL